MNYEGLMLEKKNNYAILTVNRPDSLNSVTPEMMYKVFPQLLGEIQVDDSIRVLIITGAGRGFSAGADVSKLLKSLKDDTLQADMEPNAETMGGPFALSLFNLEKPVIAAINGAAAGMGVSMALLSDIRIASDKATFSLAFIKRGLVPDCGCTYIMPRLVGVARSLEYMFTGDSIDAREAERIGMVNKVVPHDKLLEEAEAMAVKLAAMPPIALKQIKRAVHLGIHNSLEQQLYLETYAQKYCFQTEDFKEGIESFLNKRPPQFKGR